jgi:hypothetical protein
LTPPSLVHHYFDTRRHDSSFLHPNFDARQRYEPSSTSVTLDYDTRRREHRMRGRGECKNKHKVGGSGAITSTTFNHHQPPPPSSTINLHCYQPPSLSTAIDLHCHQLRFTSTIISTAVKHYHNTMTENRKTHTGKCETDARQ